MRKDLQLCIGKLVEIIYMNKYGEMTQRRIKIISIGETQIKAFCYTKQAARTFLIENILAFLPVTNQHAV